MIKSWFKAFSSRKGFSLVELLLFSVIFTGLMIAFISVLVAITSIQARQSSVAEVNQQSQFLLQQIQQLTERSSLIELPQDTATTTLKLRMASSSEDPTYITISSGIIYLQQGTGAQNPLTSNRVTVSSLTFTKRSNPPGHDSVAVSFLVTYNSVSVKQKFSQLLSTAVARVSAATFDSNVVPSSSGSYKLGVSGSIWSSVNDAINFVGTCGGGSNCVGVNLGAGVSPTQVFQVGSGDIYISTPARGVILRNSSGCALLKYADVSGLITTTSVPCT